MKRARTEDTSLDLWSIRKDLNDHNNDVVSKICNIQDHIEKIKNELSAFEKVKSTGEQSFKAGQQEAADKEDEEVVKLNISGELFTTTKKTLTSKDNYFKTMINTNLDVDVDENGYIIVEQDDEGCDPKLFSIVLDYLRTGSLTKIGVPVFDYEKLEQLLSMSNYYLIEELWAYLSDMVDTFTERKKMIPIIKKEEPFQEPLDVDLIEKFSKLNVEQIKKTNDYYESMTRDLQKVLSELEKTKEEKQIQIKLDLQQLVKFNVGGCDFEISHQILNQYKDSHLYEILSSSLNNNVHVFIDRDSSLFKYIHTFLISGNTNHLPHNDSVLMRSIEKEVQFFQIAPLVDHFNPVRYPIETIGQENILLKKNEDYYRKLFAVDRQNPILDDPYLNLIPVFQAHSTFAMDNPDYLNNIPLMFDFENGFQSNYLFTRSPIPRVVYDQKEFLKNFKEFTNSLFENVNWNNLFVAGGSVLGCLMTKSKHGHYFLQSLKENILAEQIRTGQVPSKELQKENQNSTPSFGEYRSSDIDIFLYGLTEDEAEAKIEELFESFKSKANSSCAIIRTKHAISFIFDRCHHIQIILRIYKSPAEILIGFDVDSCCVGFDGKLVWASPRARRAIKTRMNLVDVDRQSTTYEVRLYKYARRGFRVGVPGLDYSRILNQGLIIGTHTFRRRSRWMSSKTNRASLFSSSGLSRLLLFEAQFKVHSRHQAYTRIGIENCQNLYKLENTLDYYDRLEKNDGLKNPDDKLFDKQRDYEQIHLYYNYSKQTIDNLKQYVEQINKDREGDTYLPKVLFALDDLKSVMNGSSNPSLLQGPIEWLVIDPGTQKIGSFNPTERNFYEDAYSLEHSDNKKYIKYK
ncbi:hypothetical protein AKO1_009299 [Acrasis kona]|uniref:BTB domain-containing protein n=1 Tax=Acrasis kona TaxID=1008807 RepID=A0AAW2ZKW1_9EUKA